MQDRDSTTNPKRSHITTKDDSSIAEPRRTLIYDSIIC